MKHKLRLKLSTVFLVLGCLLLVPSLLYEALEYPWGALLARWGFGEIRQDLPDPAPIPDAVQITLTDLPEEGKQALPEFSTDEVCDLAVLAQIGIIKIPKIGISENIVEGSDQELFYAVGHVEGTAAPGATGNCVLAGHRAYIHRHPFRYLHKMEIGDKVSLEIQDEEMVYEVFHIFEVEEDESWILAPQPEEDQLLTLLTCTPLWNPTRRLILWCRPAE